MYACLRFADYYKIGIGHYKFCVKFASRRLLNTRLSRAIFCWFGGRYGIFGLSETSADQVNGFGAPSASEKLNMKSERLLEAGQSRSPFLESGQLKSCVMELADSSGVA